MAFVTGTILIAGCIGLILKYGTSTNVKALNAVLWIAHGWLFLIYVMATAALGVRLRWPLARLGMVMLAGTIPTMSFVAEHFVTRAARQAAEDPQRFSPSPTDPSATRPEAVDQIGPRPRNARADRAHRARAHVRRLGVGQPQHLGEDERLAPLRLQSATSARTATAPAGSATEAQPARPVAGAAAPTALRPRTPGARSTAATSALTSARGSGAATRTPARTSPGSGRRPTAPTRGARTAATRRPASRARTRTPPPSRRGAHRALPW